MSGIVTGGMPLYISGPPLNPIASGIQLYLFGTSSVSGVQGGIPLILAAESGNLVNGSMNLFLGVDSFAPVSGQMNLYLQGGNAYCFNGIDLFLANNPTSSGLSLYIKGLGYVGDGNLASDYHPYQSGLNLFIERDFGNGCMLYIRGRDINASGRIDLFTHGAFGHASGLALSMPNVTGPLDNSLTLTIQGF